MVGTDTQRLFADSHALLHTWFAHVEDRMIEGVAHLSPQRPGTVVQGVAEFFARHRIAGWQLNEAASSAIGD